MSHLAEQIRKAEEKLAKLKAEQVEEEQKREAALEAEVIRWLKEERSDRWAQWLADATDRLEVKRRKRSENAKKAHAKRRAKEQAKHAAGHAQAERPAQSNGRQNVWVGHAQRPA